MTGTCRFCGVRAGLCYSHIIPELCYLAAYDPLHRATKFQAEPSRKKLIQKGLREYLLCSKCENRFSRWENAFKQFWFSGPALPQRLAGDYFVVKGFNYRLFKLFHLSIFWRASIAAGQEFNTVAMGAEEEKIRRLLEAEDPGPEDHYPMFGNILMDDKRAVAYGLVGKPQRAVLEGCQAYYAPYAGVEWTLMVTTDPSPHTIQQLLPLTIKARGEMFLAAVPLAKSNTVKIFREQYQDGDANAART